LSFIVSFIVLLTDTACTARAGARQSAGIVWRNDIQSAAREATTCRKPILIMAKAAWCGPCRRMLQQTFSDRSVAARVNAHFVPLLVDADQHAAVIQQLKISAFPTTLILDSNRRIVDRVTGFQSANQMNARLTAVRLAEPRQPFRAAVQAARPAWHTPSFHDRVWASIREDSARKSQPLPGPAPRDTFSAAQKFSLVR
jgi:hypothetical protein